MARQTRDFFEVIARWPSIAEFAADIGIDVKHARGMRLRRSVPPFYWPALVKSARRRGYSDITPELLMGIGGSPYRETEMRLRIPGSKREVRREKASP